MLSYVVKRAIYSIFPFFGASLIAFVLFRLEPGDPALLMVGIGATPAQIQAERVALGENLPVFDQYFIWLKDIFTGNFGVSLFYHQSVSTIILQKLPATLELVIVATILALLLGIGSGVLSALREDGKLDGSIRSFSYIAFGVPDFIWGLILIVLFGAYFKILPISGEIDPSINITHVSGFLLIDSLVTGNAAALLSTVEHLVLPSIALALVLMAIIQKTVRSSLVEVLREDYIVTDRMKGLSETYIVYVRALKNSLIPAVTILGVQFTFLMSGSILIELIFGWPGLGNAIFTAIQYKDYPLLEGIVVFYAILVIIVNLVVDILYSFLNPKIQYAKR